jgi:hypothetical protein
MKKLLLICLLITVTSNLFAQNLPAFDEIKLDKKEDYKNADTAVMQAANFILSTPIDQNAELRQKAAHFVIKWMQGTPYHTFSLEQNAIQYLSDNVDLMFVYMAAMAKDALQHQSDDLKALTINGVKTLLVYVNNPANNVKKDKNLKKLTEENDKGNLDNFLNL